MVKPTAELTRFLASSLVMMIPATAAAAGKCSCDPDDLQGDLKTSALLLPYKVEALFEILAAGAVGVVIPLAAGKKLRALRPGGDVFFMVKAFAAGVILATGFVHILPDAFGSLGSPCLGGSGAWGEFPFAGFVAMAAAVGTLMVDCAASGYYMRVHFRGKSSKGGGAPAVVGSSDDEESGVDHDGHVHVHTHATHGHAHGDAVPPEEELDGLELIRQRVTSQVLEVGVMVHSVIIGVTLGASGSLISVKPLTVALSFHQFFEGMGLAGCITQAKFKVRTMVTMAVFFSLTTPLGIGIGIGISNVYSENSPTALIVQGILGAASAGILIYMALVDLLAADFNNPKVQNNPRLQVGTNIALLLGAACMSVLAVWA